MYSSVSVIARYTLLEALRSRFLVLSLLLLAGGFVLAGFIGELSITEHQQTRLALLAAFLRLGAVLLLALFVVAGSQREMQDKTLEMILAMPITRSSYYLGKLGGFLVLALLLAGMDFLLLLCFADIQQALFWSLSLFLELSLVAALGLVMLFSFRQLPAALLAVLLFYFAARIMPVLYLMAQASPLAASSLAQDFSRGFIGLLLWLLPALSDFTRSEWLMYNTGSAHELLSLLPQTLVYLLLLSMVSLFDFHRRNF